MTDTIIVGFGAAGATLARFLSDPDKNGNFPDNNIVVLEAGENKSQSEIVRTSQVFPSADSPGSFMDLGANPEFANTFGFKSGAHLSPGGLSTFFHTEGRLWGGGSAHNYLFAMRGTKELFDEWVSTLGSEGQHWLYENLLPFMKELETYIPTDGGVLDPKERGDKGMLKHTQESFNTVANNIFIKNAFAPATNMKVVQDYNTAEGSTGISPLQYFLTNGFKSTVEESERSHAQNSFMPTPLDSPVNPDAVIDADGRGLNGRKIRIISKAKVSRVLFDGDTAVGVEYLLDGGAQGALTMLARKEVILCAGSTSSPAILQRSGVGPQAVLEPLGINPVFYNDNVGDHLVSHFGTTCVMEVSKEENLAPAGPAHFFSDGWPYFNGGQASDDRRRIHGVLASGPFLQAPAAATFALDHNAFTASPLRSNSFIGVNAVSKSEGTVHISSTDSVISPTMTLDYYGDSDGALKDGSDLDLMIAFFKIIKDVADFAGEKMLYPTNKMFLNDDLLAQAAKFSPVIWAHPSSTCRMGTSADNGVCDSRLNVFGVKNLRVADLSVAPVVIDATTSFPAMHIGRVCAAIIRNEI